MLYAKWCFIKIEKKIDDDENNNNNEEEENVIFGEYAAHSTQRQS